MKHNNSFIPYQSENLNDNEVEYRSQHFYDFHKKRRSLRDFSDQWIPKSVITNLIKTACTAPSGANKQPWHFCAVSNPETKKAIRMAAEKEEYEFYNGRASEE